MNLGLANRVYIVSGSSRGVGKGIADVLLSEGCRVVLTGRSDEPLQSTFRELENSYSGRVLKSLGDLTCDDALVSVEKLVLGKWSKIHGVIANAGSVKPVPHWDIEETDWEWYLESNLKVAFKFVTHFIPHLEKTNGSIVFIGSIAGFEDFGAPLPYSSSKAALTMYAKGLARRLAPLNIRVNTIAPGNIFFRGGNWEKKEKSDPKGVKRMLREKVPLRKFGSPEDIGNAVAFLLSEKASFITGSCLVVDGGQTSFLI